MLLLQSVPFVQRSALKIIAAMNFHFNGNGSIWSVMERSVFLLDLLEKLHHLTAMLWPNNLPFLIEVKVKKGKKVAIVYRQLTQPVTNSIIIHCSKVAAHTHTGREQKLASLRG